MGVQNLHLHSSWSGVCACALQLAKASVMWSMNVTWILTHSFWALFCLRILPMSIPTTSSDTQAIKERMYRRRNLRRDGEGEYPTK
jgi:hypothetical protein